MSTPSANKINAIHYKQVTREIPAARINRPPENALQKRIDCKEVSMFTLFLPLAHSSHMQMKFVKLQNASSAALCLCPTLQTVSQQLRPFNRSNVKLLPL